MKDIDRFGKQHNWCQIACVSEIINNRAVAIEIIIIMGVDTFGYI